MARPTRSEDVPHSRLTRLCDAMTVALEAHPEYRHGIDKAIILIDDDSQGGAVRHGYPDGPEGDIEAAYRLLGHAEALHELNDIPFAVAQIPHRGQG